jgi:hypothetical protein
LELSEILKGYKEGLEKARLSYVRRYIRNPRVKQKAEIDGEGRFLSGHTSLEWNEKALLTYKE